VYTRQVSDRPGGFGGSDIYKSTLNRKGEWDEPVNLGETINTIYNENSPFLHPDNATLFFSSEGHKTMGGNDVFKSRITNHKWSEPENLGFPNSPKDDMFFVLNANGQTGYFSSAKNNIFDKHNIFKVNLKDPIPLTLVKGAILAGDPLKPIGGEIKVYDAETGTRVKYVYNPDPETGKYLMIFPPAKNYNIIISSEEYLPQLIHVHIPYQTYFYELYQQIILQPIHLDNGMVGEIVTVNNTFYDLYKTAEADSILIADELPKQPKYYDHLLELIENIIQTTDTMKINYRDVESNEEAQNKSINSLLNLIEEAIETSDPITLSILDANAQQKDKIKETHFYKEGDKSKSLQMQIIGNDTLYTAAPIISESSKTDIEKRKELKENSRKNTEYLFRNTEPDERTYIHHYTIYYGINEDAIPKKNNNELLDICKILIDNPSIGAEVFGFTDTMGEEKFNLSLSRKRAQKVLRYFIDNQVDFQKLIVKGFGESIEQNKKDDPAKFRKVEINLFEIKNQ
jgi:outer membrane protein OmpA-like peptidoglycan-associated protein